MSSGLSDTPFFSIIIPTYNSEKTVKNALKSVLNQSFSNFEIIIIDGASKDETIRIINSIQDVRIKIFSEEDKGIYDAMNKGVKYAKGKWLYFLGSDDSFFDYSVLVDIFNQIKTSSSKFIYGNVMINGNTGWARNGQIYDGEFNLEKLLSINISHQAIFYHRIVFEKCGLFNINYRVCADYDFNLKIASRFNLKYFNRTIANFIADGASTNINDYNFGNKYSSNIINYFKLILFKSPFQKFESQILNEAKLCLRNIRLVNGLYFLSIGLFFRSKRKMRHFIHTAKHICGM